MFGNFKQEVDNDEREHAVPSSQERINDALGVERVKGTTRNIVTLSLWVCVKKRHSPAVFCGTYFNEYTLNISQVNYSNFHSGTVYRHVKWQNDYVNTKQWRSRGRQLL